MVVPKTLHDLRNPLDTAVNLYVRISALPADPLVLTLLVVLVAPTLLVVMVVTTLLVVLVVPILLVVLVVLLVVAVMMMVIMDLYPYPLTPKMNLPSPMKNCTES